MLNKILIAIVLVFLICSSILIVGVVQINNRGTDLFTQSELLDQESLITLQNENVFRNLSILNKSHAYWTEGYENVLAKDGTWLSNNLTEYLVEGDFDIDFVYLSNEDGSFFQALGIQKSTVESSNLYQQVLLTNEPKESILWIDDYAYMLTGYPMATDNEENPLGVLILGRKLGENYKNLILSISSGVHNGHLVIVEDVQDISLLEEGLDIIYYESIDDTLIYGVHYQFAFATYIQETMIGHSITIVVTSFAIVLVITFLLLSIFRKEMSMVVSIIKNIDVEQDVFKALPDVKSSEINQIIHSFNNLGIRVEQNIQELKDKNLEIVRLLSMATEFNDPYTSEHSNNVCELSVLIGEKMGLPNIQKLELCAKLHDVGKVFLQHEILNKKGEVTVSEFSEIKKHPTQGAELLSAISGFDEVRLGVKHHHEKYNGTGYPDGLKGLEIPMYARIICVADVYDAITSDRPYRKAFSKADALKIMEDGREKLFDPQILDVFLEIILSRDKL